MRSDERLIHYGREPLLEVRGVAQPEKAHRWDKPSGLWFSVGDGEDGWRSWCDSETFSLANLACQTEIEFTEPARVIRLRGSTDIDAFTEEYGVVPDFLAHLYDKGYGIDWPRVCAEYDAIVIAPYCWNRRLHDGTNWYYSWDCASGCVWSASVVKIVKMTVPLL